MSEHNATGRAPSVEQLLERLDELATVLTEDGPHFHLERNNATEWEVCVFTRAYCDPAVVLGSNEYGTYGWLETRAADRVNALADAVRHCERIARANKVVSA